MKPFAATLRSEWTKLSTLRSSTVLLSLSVLLATGLSALVAMAIGATWHSASAADRAAFDPIATAGVGGLITALLFVGVGVTAATSEYASGMIRVSITATPRRGRVLLAKAAVVAAVTFVVGTIASITMFAVAQPIFHSYGLESASLGDRAALRSVLWDGALSPLLPVIAVSVGFMLRSAAGAVTTTLMFIFAPATLGGLLPQWWQDHVLVLLPGAAADALSTGHVEGTTTQLAPALAAVVLAAWIAAFLGGAMVLLQRRDA